VAQDVAELDSRYVMQTYKRLPVEFVLGEGATLYDRDGDAYLDFLAGISVCNAGHCHPRVVEAVRQQATRLFHVSNLFYTEPGARLAERLAESFEPGARAFLCNSGAEANEAAIKLARRHRRSGEIVVLEHAFHGRTMGALSATPQREKQEPFEPLVPGFVVVPRNDPERLSAAVSERTAAVMIEPIQGECGVWPISEEMLRAAREACDRAGALLVFDEIQCGMGRTGTLWAYELTGVRPDVFTVAKALASGLPIGACVAGGEAASALEAGDHGTTFGAGPLVATAALATLDVIDDDRLLARVRVLGDRLRAGLEQLRGDGRLADVRARGLMVGVDLPPERSGEAPKVVREALAEQLVLNSTGPDTLRFLPPLVIEEQHVDRVLAFLEQKL
jgi:acetylornithine aminotransferase/acetylornithine/N-succinyldiaminopimelate aminotransferase